MPVTKSRNVWNKIQCSCKLVKLKLSNSREHNMAKNMSYKSGHKISVIKDLCSVIK